MSAQQEVTVAFTRCLAGLTDYTPVILNSKELATVNFTWPHEFAQAIVYLSPITHFTDQYEFYFLKKKKQAILVYDGSSNTSSDRREQTVSKNDVLTIKLRAGGGFIAKM